MSENKKKYLKGTCKEVKTQYGEILNLSLNLGELLNFALANGSGWVNVSIAKRQEMGKFGSTHNCWLNGFKPEPKEEQ